MAALGGILGGLLEKELNLFYYIGKMKAWKKREVLLFLRDNFEERHVERIFAEIMKIQAVADSSDGKIKRPLNRIFAVRICSRLGIENSVVDGRTRSIVVDSEDSLFGHIYPVLGLEPFHCKYYAAWLKKKAEVRQFIEGLDLDIVKGTGRLCSQLGDTRRFSDNEYLKTWPYISFIEDV
jgi:hypothetical protein